MSTADKARNHAEIAKGDVKEAAGKATGDVDLEAEGRAEQVSGNIKQAGEKLKDAVRGVTR